ncbi:MAG: zinc-ribbon domain-containing protein [Proteobacteria bacterium]|nr:zinc-ribbon domain-containing protein [Pseudomonadota bacterium]
MKVQCENCQTKLNLPDDRLKPGAEFAFNCPKCQHKNTVQVPTDNSAAPAGGAETGEAEDTGGLGEFYAEGTKLALICFDAGPLRDKLAKIITELGYHSVFPKSTRDAIERIRITLFHVILLDENYEGQNRENNSIFQLLQPMDMSTRRRIFLALFGKDYKTLDDMAAYAMSVNMVVNLSDEAELTKALQKGLATYERFYKVFFETMRELGKLA